MSPPDRRPGPCPSATPTSGTATGIARGEAGRDAARQTPSTNGKVHRLMARLVGVDLPRDKRVEVALTYIFGIGRTRALELLDATGVSPDMRVHQLGDDELVKLRDYIEANFQVEGDLRREVTADIRRKVEIGSYQGRRHRQGLPVRGQRTKTNARTRKGPKRTVAGRKKAAK
jgi:small subunit ribosomal protein S13